MTASIPDSPRTQPCCLCGQQHFQLVGDKDRKGQPLRTVICATCGLISHESIPSDDELAAFYREEYREQYHGHSRPEAHRVLRAWDLGRELVEKLKPHLRQGERVYEVGAGIGCNVKQFELAGYPAAGIEPHRGFREFGVNELNARIDSGVLDDAPQQPFFDLVVLHHVLEHLPHPLQALEKIRRMLRLGGRAYVEVPNAAAPHAAPGRQFHYAHIFNFTPGTLVALATAAGFAVKHTFTQPYSENIGLLLTPDSHALARVDYSDNYRHAIADLTRLSTWEYYSRPSYLWQRIVRVCRQGLDRWQAEARLRQILVQCQPAKSEAGGVTSKKAA